MEGIFTTCMDDLTTGDLHLLLFIYFFFVFTTYLGLFFHLAQCKPKLCAQWRRNSSAKSAQESNCREFVVVVLRKSPL